MSDNNLLIEIQQDLISDVDLKGTLRKALVLANRLKGVAKINTNEILNEGDQVMTTVFDQKNQRVNTQYNAARDINFGQIKNSLELAEELKKLKNEIAAARQADKIDEDIAVDAEYQVQKAVIEAKKDAPEKGKLLDYVTNVKTIIAGVPALTELASAISGAVEAIQGLFG